MARKPTGGKQGRPRQESWRDEFVYWTVEWVMETGRRLAICDNSVVVSEPGGGQRLEVTTDRDLRGLPLGRGTKNETSNACVVAAWILSGGKSHANGLTDREIRYYGWSWLYGRDEMIFAMEQAGVPNDAQFFMEPASIRDAYQRIKARTENRKRPSPNQKDASDRQKRAEFLAWLDRQDNTGDGFPPQGA